MGEMWGRCEGRMWSKRRALVVTFIIISAVGFMRLHWKSLFKRASLQRDQSTSPASGTR